MAGRSSCTDLKAMDETERHQCQLMRELSKQLLQGSPSIVGHLSKEGIEGQE